MYQCNLGRAIHWWSVELRSLTPKCSQKCRRVDSCSKQRVCRAGSEKTQLRFSNSAAMHGLNDEREWRDQLQTAAHGQREVGTRRRTTLGYRCR